jgi:hypothetical protein
MIALADPDDEHFPEPDGIREHAIAFVRPMFAHASFEAEVRALQGAITDDPSFGERRANQWNARERPKKMARLIKAHLGEVQESMPIAKLLCDAIDPCDRRNMLAHGEWWVFNVRTSAISVRGGTRWENDETPPDHAEYTASAIERIAQTLIALS